MRRLVLPLLALGLLTGCAFTPDQADVEKAALEDIRDRATTIDGATDQELLDLMQLACELMDEAGVEGFIFNAIERDLDPYDVGVIGRNAIMAYCPEYKDDIRNLMEAE